MRRARPHSQPDRADHDLHRPRGGGRRSRGAPATFRSTRRAGIVCREIGRRSLACRAISSPGPSAHPLCYLVCYLLKSGDGCCLSRDSPRRSEIRRLLADSYLLRPAAAEDFFTDAINGSTPPARRSTGRAAAVGRAALPAGAIARRLPAAAAGRGRACGPSTSTPTWTRTLSTAPGRCSVPTWCRPSRGG